MSRRLEYLDAPFLYDRGYSYGRPTELIGEWTAKHKMATCSERSSSPTYLGA
jgi:hypothetical protein